VRFEREYRRRIGRVLLVLEEAPSRQKSKTGLTHSLNNSENNSFAFSVRKYCLALLTLPRLPSLMRK